MQNLVDVSHSVCVHARSHKNLGDSGTLGLMSHYRMVGVADPLETRYSPPLFIVANFVALGQTVCAKVGAPNIFFEGGGS